MAAHSKWPIRHAMRLSAASYVRTVHDWLVLEMSARIRGTRNARRKAEMRYQEAIRRARENLEQRQNKKASIVEITAYILAAISVIGVLIGFIFSK